MAEKDTYKKLLSHFPNISKGMHDWDQQITFNLGKAENQEARVSIIHCSGHGYYNFANSYFRMIDKTQLIQLYMVWRNLNNIKHIKQQLISWPPYTTDQEVAVRHSFFASYTVEIQPDKKRGHSPHPEKDKTCLAYICGTK